MRWGQSELVYSHDHDVERAGRGASASVGWSYGASGLEPNARGRGTVGHVPIDVQRRQAIGDVFRELRVLLGLSDVQAAQRLGTSIDIIEALESGALEALPRWDETRALVIRYTKLANIDPGTVLASLAPAFGEDAGRFRPVELARQTVSSAPAGLMHSSKASNVSGAEAAPAAPASSSPAMGHARSLRKRTLRTVQRRPVSAVFALIFPIAVIMLSWWSTSVGARPISFVADRVSGVISAAFASVYNGYRWIEVEDPRSRRGDKLQSGHR